MNEPRARGRQFLIKANRVSAVGASASGGRLNGCIEPSFHRRLTANCWSGSRTTGMQSVSTEPRGHKPTAMRETSSRCPRGLTTTVAAQGTMTDFEEASLASPGGLRGPPSKSSYGSPSFERSPLEPRFTPTPPSSSPSVPLARSKSQLTLLLERQNEKKPRR